MDEEFNDSIRRYIGDLVLTNMRLSVDNEALRKEVEGLRAMTRSPSPEDKTGKK
ncbi:MAG: hypothetical protein OEY97_07740 [Nitrospirota bacterium]|nr:hypothetical protein [Gammaproteobacteria bacterium]MDH5527182.1 hypothetical protein [Nitrospirota bacterium]